MLNATLWNVTASPTAGTEPPEGVDLALILGTSAGGLVLLVLLICAVSFGVILVLR